MAEHVDIASGEIHVAHNFEYADATAREAASLVSADIGKIARQTDNKSYWVLADNTGPIWLRLDVGGVVNAQTGTSYTILAKDRGKLVTHTNGSAIAVTLPIASTTGFGADWMYYTENRGAGAATITPTTSTIDGAATLVLNQNEGAIIFSDGTNYFTFRGKASSAGGFAASGSNADITALTALTGVLKAPTQVQDANSNEVVIFGSTGSAINEVTITNKAAGTGPTIAATGGDTDINLNMISKGTGNVQANGKTVLLEAIQVAASDETTALTTGTAKVTFRMPYAMTLTAVRGSLSTAQASGSTFTIDIKESGTTILSTKITIDNTHKTSTTAGTPPVISDTALADDAEITVNIDQIGDGTAKGLKVTLIGVRG